jgi:hypothetical protein
MIVVYAGRRPSEDDFPDSQRDVVSGRVAQLLTGLKPRLLVGAAAAGADLLAIEAGLLAGASAHLVLAGGREGFRASSVADKGGDWGALYDRILEREEVRFEELERIEGDADATYTAASRRIWETALAQRQDGEEIIVLVIARPREDGAADHSEEIATAQRLDGGVVIRIDPLQRTGEMPRAFVAMAFGTGPWPERDLKVYRCDLTYQRILLPALIGAGYEPMRADTQALMEVVDSRMLGAIARAELLVADLATENPNVMWELGVRHAWRSAGTIVIAPEDTRIPFNVARVPVHSYRRHATKISDRDCVAALQKLSAVLADVERNDPDSPVFLHLPGLSEVELGPEEPGGEEDSAGVFLEQITLAADLHRVEDLITLAERIQTSDRLNDSSRAPLREQVGLALIEASRHREATEILRPIAEADVDFSSRQLQERFAHALIRHPDAEGRDERLAEAEARLQRLIARPPSGGEAWGLLGSAGKARVELALASNGDPLPHLQLALSAYERGMRTDPGDHYPGVNALALRRLRGQRLAPNEDDLRRAAELAPVVRFAVLRRGEQALDEDVWAILSLAECALHRLLLGDEEDARVEMQDSYARAAQRLAPNQRRSVTSQLQLFLAAGDPPELIEPLLALFD